MDSLKLYLKEIRTIPLLTAEQEIKLARRIKKHDDRARKDMIRANLRLVINIAKRYMYLGIPLLDLIEEGNIGLMKAVDRFNPARGFRFSTYAAWWIRQSVTRCISDQGKLIRMPVYMNELISKWKKEKERLSQKLKRMPSDEEIGKRLKISSDQQEQINFWLASRTSSLDAPVGEEGETQVSDMIEDTNSVAPDAGIEHLLDKERVKSLLDLMPDRERQVLLLRYGLLGSKAQTLAQIAKKWRISRERVRQIEEGALKKIRTYIKQRQEEL
jgi:RNA polymerase primary sigma factor